MRRFTVVSAIAATALLLTGVTAPAVAADGEELFFSEYIEGSSNNKALEIYNPTGEAVDLSAYAVKQYSNGAVTAGLTLSLTGTLAAGEAYVIAHSLAAAAILAQADLTTSAGLFNGDDALELTTTAGTVVDVIGQIGSDPGVEWGASPVSTLNTTLRRLADVCAGDTNGADAFDPAAQWEGLAVDTFDGLGAHTANCGDVEPPTPTVVINEFSASTVGTDVEYVELLATPPTDLSTYRVLAIEGDAGSAFGAVDQVLTVPAPDASGRALASLTSNTLENGTLSLVLVTGSIPEPGVDLDVEDDGILDEFAGMTIVDTVAVNDGGAGDMTYGSVALGIAYDTLPFAPGGASRIPDGTDTDSAADWVRNDFDLAGIPGSTGTLVEHEASNTPGTANAAWVDPDPDPTPGDADCDADVVTIGSVQGSGATSPVVGQTVRVEGVVVGDFQATGQLTGYHLQDAGDGDAATSDGIFVFAPGATALAVSVGDIVNVAGVVSEFASAGGTLTEITASDAEICATGAVLPAPVAITLPAGPEVYEPLESMSVTFPQPLSILEYFEYGRFGSVDVGLTRQMQPTAVFEPGSAEATALAAQNASERITLDDGRGIQNPDPAIHPNGAEFTLANSFRGGDLLTGITGVLDYRFGGWTVQPTEGADYTAVNARPAVPEVSGEVTVSSFNVLNYFTTLTGPDARGANDPVEFERQEAKIVAALAEIDADVFGLIEIENNGLALETLTAALNEHLGAEVYDSVETGPLGTDVITTALIYKPATVTPVGEYAVLDSTVDPDFRENNRPALAQTFEQVGGSEPVTVVVNHLKSKGSDCNALGDPDLGDGAGNCNITRTMAATALHEWLAGDPTEQGAAGRELIIGDLNSYDKEDPIDALTGAGFTDQLLAFQGENAYSYVFDGQLGYLDYALAGTELAEDVTGAEVWRINADEPSLIDYDMDFKQPAQDALFAPDPYRSSDHDPVVVGLDLTLPDTTPPTITATADPALLFPPNGKARTVTIEVDAADESGEVTVELISATASGNKKAAIQTLTDTTFSVTAAAHSVYTITYQATDAAGNTSTATVVVRVGR